MHPMEKGLLKDDGIRSFELDREDWVYLFFHTYWSDGSDHVTRKTYDLQSTLDSAQMRTTNTSL